MIVESHLFMCDPVAVHELYRDAADHCQSFAADLFPARTLADGTLYSDQVARRVGDLITIRVMETTDISDNQQTDLERSSDGDARILMIPGAAQPIPSPGGTDNNALPGLAWESEKNFEGAGSYSRQGRLETKITGRVIDVLANGNLVIGCRRAVTYNKETKTVLITGICRTADITTDNTILSEKMHDFQVAVEGEGPLSRQQQEGWLARLMDTVWPL